MASELQSQLLKAINANDVAAVQSAIDAGASVNGESPKLDFFFQSNPLHLAIQNGRDEIVEVLLKRGADPLQRGDNTPWSPIMLASILQHMPARRHRPARVAKACRKMIPLLRQAGGDDDEVNGILGGVENEKQVLKSVLSRGLSSKSLVFDAEGLLVEYPQRLGSDLIGKLIHPFPLLEVAEANRLSAVVAHLRE